MARPAAKLLAAGLLLLGLGVLLVSLAAPLADFIESKVQQAIHQQVVWQPDSPRSVAGVPRHWVRVVGMGDDPTGSPERSCAAHQHRRCFRLRLLLPPAPADTMPPSLAKRAEQAARVSKERNPEEIRRSLGSLHTPGLLRVLQPSTPPAPLLTAGLAPPPPPHPTPCRPLASCLAPILQSGTTATRIRPCMSPSASSTSPTWRMSARAPRRCW